MRLIILTLLFSNLCWATLPQGVGFPGLGVCYEGHHFLEEFTFRRPNVNVSHVNDLKDLISQSSLKEQALDLIERNEYFSFLKLLEREDELISQRAHQILEEKLMTLEVKKMIELNGHGSSQGNIFLVEFRNGMKAVYKKFNQRELQGSEVVAYKLNRLLNINLIPPTVNRSIDNQNGSLQYWIEDFKSALTTRQLEIDPDLIFFDMLIGNKDRNRGNWGRSRLGNFIGIDHGLSFRQDATLLLARLPTPSEKIKEKILEQGTLLEIREIILNSNLPNQESYFAFIRERYDAIVNELLKRTPNQDRMSRANVQNQYDFSGNTGSGYFFYP